MDLLEKIREAGIVGAGGAGFPTNIKLKGAAQVILVNGGECEPLLKTDQYLAENFPKQLVLGLLTIMEALSIKEGIFAFKKKYTGAIAAINYEINQIQELSVYELPVAYPVGDEVVLVYEVLKKVVPKGGIPLQQGVIVINVETVLNVYNKVYENENVNYTYMTLTGQVSKPGIYKVPVGTKIVDLFSGMAEELQDKGIISGGPMTGKIVDADEVIDKTTKGIIVLPQSHSLLEKKEKPNMNHVRRIMATCSQCRNCTDMCPRNLLGHKVEPHKLMNSVANGLTRHTQVLKTALGCCSCGVCELYACDHGLSPRLMMMAVKTELLKSGEKVTGEDMEAVSLDRENRKIPSERLLFRLGLKNYDTAPIELVETLSTRSVSIPLKQHVGAPTIPLIKVGELVERGQVIGAPPEKALGACIHASITGKVIGIDSKYINIERTGL